jgi:ectoine hydroxylase
MESLRIEERAEPRNGLSSAEVYQYQRDGFLTVKGLFSMEEVGLLRRVLKRDHEFLDRLRTGLDHEGNPVTIWISNRLRSDVLAAFVRSRHLVEIADLLLGDEAYHWHHKITFKESRNGGAWEWHQDYGYWYDYGCLFPDLVSVMIAIDRATPANGCLELIRGSHRLGRLDTSRRADQTSVGSEERLRAIQEEMEVVSCPLEPGDATFFHANTLHRSGVNRSEYPRWALLCVYNARQNAPRDIPSERPHDPDAPPSSYVALERWPRSRIAELAHHRVGGPG